jgi:hypothetical protein
MVSQEFVRKSDSNQDIRKSNFILLLVQTILERYEKAHQQAAQDLLSGSTGGGLNFTTESICIHQAAWTQMHVHTNAQTTTTHAETYTRTHEEPMWRKNQFLEHFTGSRLMWPCILTWSVECVVTTAYKHTCASYACVHTQIQATTYVNKRASSHPMRDIPIMMHMHITANSELNLATTPCMSPPHRKVEQTDDSLTDDMPHSSISHHRKDVQCDNHNVPSR